MAVENTTQTDEQNTTTTTTNTDEQNKTVSHLDEQLAQKRELLTQAQITQTNAYSEYLKVMKAKTIIDEKETDKLDKLNKLMFEYFTTYQNVLEQSQKIQVELSELESQKYLDDLLG